MLARTAILDLYAKFVVEYGAYMHHGITVKEFTLELGLNLIWYS